MLRIERSGNGQVLFTLSGRIEEEEIRELQQLPASEKSGQQLIFNLRDVTLVNQAAVKFLAQCEAQRIKLENCPLHIRTWINQVIGGPRQRRCDEKLCFTRLKTDFRGLVLVKSQ